VPNEKKIKTNDKDKKKKKKLDLKKLFKKKE